MSHLSATLTCLATTVLVIALVTSTLTPRVSCQVNHVVDQDLQADGTTIIFRPLFVYKMQKAQAEKRRKMREEWEKLHPNLNYYDYRHNLTRK
ncbi:hypothetical protein pipiens_005451 [Culex pipiens pipiens]|uniref:Uncharacterized protein n=1 Tax=Culex pipiens pipiens TaxID=38569 RepID=A0ABD1DWY2_CULPP